MSTEQIAFEPVNSLESLLFSAQMGTVPATDFLAQLLVSQVFVLLDKDPGPTNIWDNSSSPLVLTNSNGSPVLAVFTSPERSGTWPQQFPQFCYGLLTDFSWLIKGIAPSVGLVINPGSSVGMELPPYGVQNLKTNPPVSPTRT